MSDGEFEVQLQELAKVEVSFRAISDQMEHSNQQLGQVRDTISKAAAFDLLTSQLAGLAGLGAAVEVLGDVKKIAEKSAELHTDQQQLLKGLAADAEKIKAVRAEYEATEKKIEENLKRHHRPGSGSGPGTGKGSGTGTGTGSGTGSGGSTGTKTDAAAIPVSQVAYGGKGTYEGGQAACEKYINQALDNMGITDPTARANWMRGMLTIASRESAYNSPNYQVNTYDVNAQGAKMADGAPANCSRGGWQCIPGTFAAYHQPGTSTDIYDPVANCSASMNYIMSRYGVSRDGSDLAAKVQQADPNRSPRGY